MKSALPVTADRTTAGSGIPPLLLPFSRQPGPGFPFQPHTVPVTLSAETARQLSALASDPACAFLAAWCVLLWRFTDQTPIVVGSAVSHRTPSLVSIRLSDQATFRDIVGQVEGASYVTSDPESFYTAAFRMGDGCASDLSLRFQIMFHVRRCEDQWTADLLYDQRWLPRDTAERMARSLATLLVGAAADPGSIAYALPILNEKDWQEVTVAFNQTAASYPADRCIHELFEDQVKRWPDRVAVRDRKQSLTYDQLNRRANGMAHFLRQRGAAPNQPIALYLDRSVEMIMGLLGILKAGACYLPLLPTDPQPRVARQIKETTPRILVTTQALASSLPAYDGKIVFIDQPFAVESAENPELRTTSDDLVYILFTSGSTGFPKAVATRHSNVVNYTWFICRELKLEDYPEGWHFATVSTLAADLGNTSIFGALTSGGCLHVIDYETAMTPALFARYMAGHPMDLLKIAPSHLAALLRETEGGAVLPRRILVIGGEKLTWELLGEIRKRGSCAVMNHCGPTETTIGCCTLIVNEEALAEWRPATIPLGRPIANDQVYILDRRMQPVPVGVAGELYMSGAGLSRGYYNQPELTAERFLANPFSSGPAGRLYRTGDLGRFLPDGTIEFLGRADHQVKIRGFRIEPAEIEAALRRHPEVRQAAVVAEEDQHGEKSLVGYAASSPALATDVLREFLSRQLPDYMMPARLVILEDLPLNANGKIDLQALSELGKQARNREKAVVRPRNAEEQQLAAIWAEVLGLEEVNADADFFALGGHSLLATRILSRMRKVFRVNFPLYAFLESPTIQACAARLGEFERLAADEDEELARLLREIGDMTEEEARQLAARYGGETEP